MFHHSAANNVAGETLLNYTEIPLDWTAVEGGSTSGNSSVSNDSQCSCGFCFKKAKEIEITLFETNVFIPNSLKL